MTVQRKGVLLRLAPDLLARVDRARGVMPRSEWLVLAVLAYLTHWDATGERPSAAEHAKFMDRSERKLSANMGAVGHRFPDQYDNTFGGTHGTAGAGSEPPDREPASTLGAGEGSESRSIISTSSSERGVPSARDQLDTSESKGLGYDGTSGDEPSDSLTPYDPAAW